MNIALFGATGTIGSRILAEALSRGHQVTAIARDPSKVANQPNVKAVSADVLDPSAVSDAVKGHDAVVSAYAAPHETPATLLDATRSLIQGTEKAGIKRIVMVGGAGSLEVAPGLQLVNTPDFPAAWKEVAQTAADSLGIYRKEAGNLDWTYFSPAALIEPGERTGTFRLGEDQLVADVDGNSKISAEDYAVALVDELEKPQHVGKRFTAAY